MFSIKRVQAKLNISAKLIVNIARSPLGNVDEANTKNTHFISAKASVSVDCRGEFRRLWYCRGNIPHQAEKPTGSYFYNSFYKLV